MDVFISRKIWLTGVLVLLVVLSVFSVLNIEKNTSAFFLEKTHPARADHIGHQQVFSRSGYSTFVLLRLNEALDIYRNELVSELEAIHESLDPISLLEFVDHQYLAEKYGLQLNAENRVFKDKEEAITLYNSLIQEHKKSQLDTDFAQYLFPLKAIKSLINTDNIYEQDDELIIESSYKKRTSWTEFEKDQIAENLLLQGSMFSTDERGALVQIEFAIDDEDTALNLALTKKIEQTISALTAQSAIIESVHYAGGPILNNAISEVMQKDNATYFPLVILFVLTTLVIFFRSILCAIYGLLIAVLSILFTMALMPIFGVSLNIVTTILPVFIITIAVTDAIHVMSDVSRSSESSQLSAVKQSIRKLFRPMFLTSLTTGIGFLSLSLTEISNIYGFGIMVAVSVVIAFVLSITVLPLLLTLRPIHSKLQTPESSKLNILVEQFNCTVTERKWPAVLCFAMAASITLMGLPALKIDQASIDAFDEQSTLHQDNAQFIESGTGSVGLTVWFHGETESAILSSEMLSLIQDVQRIASQHEMYVDSLSLIDFLQRIHTVMQGQDAEALDLDNSELIRQYLFLLEGGSERDLESVVMVGDYKQTRLALSLARDNSVAVGEIITAIENVMQDKLPEGVEVSYAGYAWMVYATAEEVFVSQLNSLLCSLIAISLIFLIVFRSLSVTLIGMLPLSATLITMFGVMGIFGFPLDIGSSLVSGIAFGIGIDYAIHLIEAMRRVSYSNNRINVIRLALAQVTFPIGISAIVLSSGFSLLLLSGFKSLASLGLLIMVAMLVSAVFSLVIMPFVLKHLPEAIYLAVVNQDKDQADTKDQMNTKEQAGTNDELIFLAPQSPVSESLEKDKLGKKEDSLSAQ